MPFDIAAPTCCPATNPDCVQNMMRPECTPPHCVYMQHNALNVVIMHWNAVGAECRCLLSAHSGPYRHIHVHLSAYRAHRRAQLSECNRMVLYATSLVWHCMHQILNASKCDMPTECNVNATRRVTLWEPSQHGHRNASECTLWWMLRNGCECNKFWMRRDSV